VYKQLIRLLADFGPDNWTSKLRNFVPGFTPFTGEAYADFTYLDRQGQLTRSWFGAEKAAEWHGRWPRYHIEVKSTGGEESEPFHMSRFQMATVRVLASFVRASSKLSCAPAPFFLVGVCVRGASPPWRGNVRHCACLGNREPRAIIFALFGPASVIVLGSPAVC